MPQLKKLEQVQTDGSSFILAIFHIRRWAEFNVKFLTLDEDFKDTQ